MNSPVLAKTRSDNRVVAEENDLAVLKLVRSYGHLRRSEIARGVWPHSSSTVASKMAKRTVKRLLDRGLLLEKPNALGGRSLVLPTRAVAFLKNLDIEAADGYELSSVAGPQFFHRTLGTCYLMERSARGHHAYGEYALQKGWGSIGRGELNERFNKIPDGIVLTPGVERGYDSSVLAADWIEVESSYKPEDELEKIFKTAWRVGSWLNTGETLLLDRVLFIYDARHRHESAVLRALKRYLDAHPGSNPEILSSIIFVRCEVGYPLVWRGCSEFDSAHLLEQKFSTNNESI